MVKINLKSLQEDLRKIGIAFILAGFANVFLAEHSYIYSPYIITIGVLLWFFGIIEKRR